MTAEQTSMRHFVTLANFSAATVKVPMAPKIDKIFKKSVFISTNKIAATPSPPFYYTRSFSYKIL